MKLIPASELTALIKKLLHFPRPTICRHYVCCDLLNILERYDWPVSNELAAAVVDSDDERALLALDRASPDFDEGNKS